MDKAEDDDKLIYYPFESNGDPGLGRDENICFSIKLLCCPKLGLFQFITIISIVEGFIYALTLCIYGITNDDFLSPNFKTLKIMGAADAKSLKNNY